MTLNARASTAKSLMPKAALLITYLQKEAGALYQQGDELGGLGLYSWTALPLQASAGSKLRSAARGLTLRPTSDCGRCGFRWR